MTQSSSQVRRTFLEFWQMGDTGPCGPCTEIPFFNGGDVDVSKFHDEPTSAGLGWTDLWNLVFMQFERSQGVDGAYKGKTSNYETDLLRALVDLASSLSGKPYTASQADDDVSMRVLADHARTTAFLIAEGCFDGSCDGP
jgi:alanyl-tRNA synthetase